MNVYTVRKGDTLSKIATSVFGDWRKYNLIMKVNNIENPSFIVLGMLLEIPDIKTHTVKSGDTLGKISDKYYGDWRMFGLLMEENNLTDPNKIKVGQKLKVPLKPGETSRSDITGPPRKNIIIDTETMKLKPRNYFQDIYHKDCIILHFTAGSTAKSAYNTFNKPKSHIATPFILDTDGKIYQTYDPKYWSYHIGIREGMDKTHQNDKRSIAIEIVNVGPLKQDKNNPNQLNWWLNNYNKKWCAKNETDMYVHKKCRDREFFATFKNKQYKALAQLIKFLKTKYDIKTDIPTDKTKTDVDIFSYFKGILTHQNFRKDKYDMGPAFNWDKFLNEM
jgi:LysM repeat protein